jgi:hypothetical protein
MTPQKRIPLEIIACILFSWIAVLATVIILAISNN